MSRSVPLSLLLAFAIGGCSDPDGLPFGGGEGGGDAQSVGGNGSGNGGPTGGQGSGAAGGSSGSCGDAVCDAAESCEACPADCGACGASCGNQACEASESCQTCPADCGGCCAHDKCQSGTKLSSGCDPCVTQICQQDPYCCESAWDAQCVGQVTSVCGISCSGGFCGDGACGAGESCSSCATDCGPCGGTCGDGTCSATESCQTCATDCGACGQCNHGPCVEGGPLDINCSACTQLVCGTSPTCCTTSWTADCVLFATFLCTPCV